MKILLCLLACAICPIFAREWSSPRPLMSVEGMTILYGTFTDSTSSKTHFLFTTDGGDELFYLGMLHGRIQHLAQVGFSTKQAFISGNEDSHHIYIGYTSLDGKVEFIESDTDGKTWTKPQEMTKRENCLLSSLVYLNETGRLYGIMTCDKDIIFVTRPAGSSVFTFERILYSDKENFIHSAASCYTFRRNLPLLHVTWTTGYNINYMQSIDNGISWSTPYVLPLEITNKGHTTIRMLSNYHITRAVFLLYRNSEENEIRMVYSTDNCDTWSSKILVDEFWPHAVLYGTAEKKVLATVGNKYQEWTDWETGHINVKEYDTPFDLSYPALLSRNGNNPFEVTLIGAQKTDTTILGTATCKCDSLDSY